MGSSIKINSISIDLAGAVNEIDIVNCDHFSIRRYVAESRERDPRKCWPFSEESVSLVHQQSYTIPSSSVPKFRWWGCESCTKDIKADGQKDCGLHSNSTSISGIKLDGSSSVNPSQSKLNSLAVIDQEKERKTDTAGNAVEENKDVNCTTSQKDDQTATTFLKKAHPRSMDASTVKSKSRKLVGNKRSKEEKVNKSSLDISSCKERQNVEQALTTFGSSEIAGEVDDTPPKAIKNHKGSRVLTECDSVSSASTSLAMSGLQRRKPRKVRLLIELFDADKTKTSGGSNSAKKEEPTSKKEAVKGRKRKLVPENNYVRRILSTSGATSENDSKSCDSDEGDSESTDSGFDRDPIKGKQKNRRFQVVDELLPSLPCDTSQEGIRENVADPGKSALSTPVHSSSKEKDSDPCPLSTQRTEKKLTVSRKKKSKAVTDDGKSALIIFSNGMDEGNQVKPRNGPSINADSPSTRDLSDDSLTLDGYIRKTTPQRNDKLAISLHMQDNGHVRSRDAEANCLKSSSNSNTGGWLRTGVDFVDFSSNNKDPDRSSFPNFDLRNASSSAEVADRSCVLKKDASGADGRGKTVMVQEPHGALIRQSQDRKENTPEEQNDDIPMEIVELMAKNQYERCLPDKEEDVSNKQPSQETAHRPLLIDLNETYDNGISVEENITSRPPQPCDSSARKEEHFPIRKQQRSLDFFPITQPYMPSPFGIFPPTQDNRSSAVRFPGHHNSQWLGNVPTMANQNPSPSPFRVLRACNTCLQSVPHQYREASHPMWPPSMMPPPQGHQRPVPFNMDQSTKLGMFSQPSSNENTWNLNFVAGNGKQKCGSNSEFSYGCKHGAGVGSSRSVDVYSNESSIPAMHLLSLLDPRLRSITPADHHGNTKFTKRHFPPISQSKECVELQTGESSKSAYPTKQIPFDLYSNRFAPETSGKSFPIIPPLGASSFSFQNAQASWSQHQEKRKDTAAPVFASGNEQGKFQLLGASNSMMLPLSFHMEDKEKKQKKKAEKCGNASAQTPKNSCGPIVCSVNRNPADFTIPEPGNVYMLTGENLKVRKKRAPYKKRAKQAKKPIGPVTETA